VSTLKVGLKLVARLYRRLIISRSHVLPFFISHFSFWKYCDVFY